MSNNSIHSQFELFPKKTSNEVYTAQNRLLLKDLTVSVENIIVLFIVFVMITVISFAFGVERGKKFVLVKETNKSRVENDDVVILSSVGEDKKIAVNPQTRSEESINTTEVRLPEETIKEAPVSSDLLKEEANKTFTIQVASWRTEKSAKTEAKSLKDIGYEIFVLPKGKYSIVCVGKFFEYNQAQKFSDRLRSKYKDCLVRRL